MSAYVQIFTTKMAWLNVVLRNPWQKHCLALNFSVHEQINTINCVTINNDKSVLLLENLLHRSRLGIFYLTPKKRVNRDKTDFVTKQCMFGSWLSMKVPRHRWPTVAHFKPVCPAQNINRWCPRRSWGQVGWFQLPSSVVALSCGQTWVKFNVCSVS